MRAPLTAYIVTPDSRSPYPSERVTSLGDGRRTACDLGEGVGGVFDVLFAEEWAEAEARGAALRSRSQRFVDERGAVQAGAGEDAEVALQREGQVRGRN